MMGNKEAIMHLGASYGVDKDLPTSASGDIAIRTNGRGTTFFKSPAFTNPDVTRYGLEGIAAFGPYKLAAEYNNASYESSGVADRDIDAYYINASWMVTGESYAPVYKNGLMGGRMIPKNDFAAGNGWGAWELGVRYSNFDAGDFTVASLAGGSTNKADSWTAGVKWITDPNTRFLLNYVDTSFDTAVTGYYTSVPATYKNEKALNFRAQFDF
jgi:phosphate-selective porin OprO/OprP